MKLRIQTEHYPIHLTRDGKLHIASYSIEAGAVTVTSLYGTASAVTVDGRDEDFVAMQLFDRILEIAKSQNDI